MFFVAAGLIFTVAMFVAAYYVFTVPEQQEAQVLSGRLRDLRGTSPRAHLAARRSCCGGNIEGGSAFLGDLVTWRAPCVRLAGNHRSEPT